MIQTNSRSALLFLGLSLTSPLSFAAESVSESAPASVTADAANRADELAKQLANPIAALISVPLQNNFDFGIGSGDGWRYTLNIQPVVPISIGEDWNLISRTILPVVHQQDVMGSSTQSGLGDTVQSLFLSPKEPSSGGWIWGAGPVLLLPTATDDRLGTEKWGAGPTGVALKQDGAWTYGILANHLWSYAGEEGRADVNATFLQPFVTYALGGGQTVTVLSENTYDWDNSQWSVPMGLTYARVTKLGSQLVSFGVGSKVYVDGPSGSPEWGLRLVVTLLFPK